MIRTLLSLMAGFLILGAASTVNGDQFTYVDDEGQTQTLEGSLVASGQGVHVLGKADGGYVVVPQPQLQQRDVAEPPAPVTPEAMADVLRERFGHDRIRMMVDDPYVVGLVLAGPLPEQSESRVDGFLRTAARFMNHVEAVFSKFCRELRLDTVRPEYPLVLLVFETDRDFNQYATEVTNGQGLNADRIAGFYSPLTNWLAIRIGECRSFQVPLHEAIHQQVYNRELLQRLAGVPVWFNEGIATGFENDGERINVGPTKINALYARKVSEANQLDWQTVHTDDSVFTGDVLAGEAYVHAWSMHWLLVSQYRREYSKYFRELGKIEPLQQQTVAEREETFRSIFGSTVTQLEADFPRRLKAEIHRQKIRLSDGTESKRLVHGDASEVELTGVERIDETGMIQVGGQLTNVSPFRDFSYYVTVQTDGGLYASWHLPCVKSLSQRKLKRRLVEKPVTGGPAQTGETFWVEVLSALPQSAEAEEWRRGEFPPVVWTEPAG